MGTGASISHTDKKEGIPPWINTVHPPSNTFYDTFGDMAQGMQLLAINTVCRNRAGQSETDAAQWKKGFKSGKHVFEIAFPVSYRGREASVGVGYKDCPLCVKGRVCLVGYNTRSWGISLTRRKSMHNNTEASRYPHTMVFLPDKFYMYLDADAGTLQFGSDEDFYGVAHSDINMSQPVHPMVSACSQGATITLVYRGKGVVRKGPSQRREKIKTSYKDFRRKFS
ncbi:SPRY domain-containing SOCS box protein 1-like [Physella acuta]|uniref:SPRY domain-containing SOCS box protein 1-like n=1 Tax=Physella acuta TaxID=109671 RepID=UPI0027DC2602|nr:SPRY domain-containing SOCS box protein 1-like [Physella acuta]